MNPFFEALSLFRRRKHKDCEEKCNEILRNFPSDQHTWLLKMKAITSQSYIDQLEIDETGLADLVTETNSMAVSNKVGTSLIHHNNNDANIATSFGLRKQQRTGRMTAAYLRPDTHSNRGATGLRNNLSTANRTVTRAARLATAALLTNPDDNFINLSRIDLLNYAHQHNSNKHLFNFIFYHLKDHKKAFELASVVCKGNEEDWWWKLQLAKCLMRQRQYRESVKQLKSSLNNQPFIETSIYLSKVYLKLDQPQSSITALQASLHHFPHQSSLLLQLARVQELLGETEESMQTYTQVLKEDFVSIEALACIATYHFHHEQAEIAAKYLQRLLQMGILNAECYNNLGLCCFEASQFDLCFICLNKALDLCTDDLLTSDIWFNIAHIALKVGDLKLASQCYHISLCYNDKNAESYNNMAVIEFQRGNIEMTRAFLQSSFNSDDCIFQSHFNFAILSQQLGDVQTTHTSLKKSLDIDPGHQAALNIFKSLSQLLVPQPTF